MIKVEYVEQKNGNFRLVYRFFFFHWSPTFGDGCGNDTGIPVEYKTIDEIKQWRERNNER